MYSLAALACWFGGLVLLTAMPWLGACIAATGFVLAGKAMTRPDDMETLFGLLFLLVIASWAIRLLASAFG